MLETVEACLFIQTSFRVWFLWLTAVTRINKRQTEFAFLYCSLVRGPFAALEVRIQRIGSCFTELLTFTVNRLLNDVTEVGEILGVLLERTVQIPKIQSYAETVFRSLVDVFIQTAG